MRFFVKSFLAFFVVFFSFLFFSYKVVFCDVLEMTQAEVISYFRYAQGGHDYGIYNLSSYL
jgi:hypothetical protein